MSISKYINRVHKIHGLIKQRKTGSLRQFAVRVGISKSQLHENIQELKSIGAPIEYCTKTKTYFYSEDVNLLFGFYPK